MGLKYNLTFILLCSAAELYDFDDEKVEAFLFSCYIGLIIVFP